MTKEEMLALCTWKDGEAWFGKFAGHSPLFGQAVEIHLLVENDYDISDRTVLIMNDFLKLKTDDLTTIKRFLWEGCQECCESSSYGFEVSKGQSETEANHAGFGVFNEEDAYAKSHLTYLQICEEDQELQGNYGHIHFDNEWESHGTVIVMKNGQLIGYGEDGLYVGAYEDDAD